MKAFFVKHVACCLAILVLLHCLPSAGSPSPRARGELLLEIWRLRNEIVLAHSSSSAVPRAAPSCNGGYPPLPNLQMTTCCWYKLATCCPDPVGSHLLPLLNSALEELATQVDPSSACYFDLADQLCTVCSPQQGNLIQVSMGVVSQYVCQSFCDRLYDDCRLELGADFPANISNGTQLCTQGDNEHSHVVVVPSNRDCFAGVGSARVASSHCTPYN
eukprot:CAMPEP_0177675636 /NCGR_PEP_ID=MMETSP0447-20121125/27315_1 /TAXON_ID=0 /ORGANISM="Stygamoeba regulata, Strain BSH-02190019" /LENGTH=216 /DNA_ID=CAMNT_0019184053 /DNA_START=217 /DNA_END=867 /DNA_ORIENTATION=-